MAVRRGFQAQIKYGAAGSAGTTLLTNAIDLNEDLATETAETTSRGSGSTVPQKSEVVVCVEKRITFGMIVRDDDAGLVALMAAADAGTPLAIRTLRKAGSIGFDGDVNLSYTDGRPLKGAQTVEFTCTVNDELRAPSFNV